MMQEDNNFFIDILIILPEELECYMQAPSLENSIIERMLHDSEFDYYKILNISNINKQEIIKQEMTNPFAMYIQSIKIKAEKSLLFEGFDGVEYGTISKKLVIPEWFEKKYIPDTCMISKEW